MGIRPIIQIKEHFMILFPQVKEKVFHEDIMYLIRREISFLKSGEDSSVEVDEVFNRIGKHNDAFFKELHNMITDRVSMWLGVNVKPSYNYTSMYFTGKGICPIHTDREQCVYTLDLCVNQNEPWAINIAGADYVLEEGDAMLYSGTNHVHYRKKIQENNYCDLVFFHFVPVDFTGKLD
jgi:hypothetical protein